MPNKIPISWVSITATKREDEMFKKHLIIVAIALMAFTSMAWAQIDKIAIFNESVGWTDVATAAAATDEILASVKTASDITVYNDADMGKFAEDNTADGNFDLMIIFGYFPVSLYTPGNADADGSLGELFLEGGDMILNSCDYIFYVTEGGGANGDTGLKNMTDSNFDLWTDNTVNTPTAEGKKLTPSLPDQWNAPRAFVRTQIEEDPDWEVVADLGDDGANNMDPCIIKNVSYDGMVGIAFQVSDNAMPRGPVMSEMVNNVIAAMISNGAAVKPAAKLASTWGGIKN